MSKTIKDPSLGDYEIECDDNFTLRKFTGTTIDKKTGGEIPTHKTVGYFSTIEGALTKAAKCLTIEKMGDVSSLKNYVSELRTIWDEIKSAIKI